jgi:hypothetical protein
VSQLQKVLQVNKHFIFSVDDEHQQQNNLMTTTASQLVEFDKNCVECLRERSAEAATNGESSRSTTENDHESGAE